MKTLSALFSFILFAAGMPLQAQNSTFSDAIQDSIIKQLELYPQEKIHLHVDRDMYVPGEKIWFKAYVTDAITHQSPTYSRYVYTELINSSDSVVYRVMVRRDNDMYHGHLFISDVIPEGEYTIRAHTRYMENMGDDYFFKKNIYIGNLAEGVAAGNAKKKQGTSSNKSQGNYEVSFYPEGGNLLEGTSCRVAFKVLNKNGYSEAISGDIVDDKGEKITNVNTIHSGMGSFYLTAAKGKRYFLECSNGSGVKKRFKLPDVTNTYSINTAWNPKNNKLFVYTKKSENSPDIPKYCLIHCRGVLLYFSQWNDANEYIAFSNADFPSGVLQILLLDNDMNPLSERLVFNKTEDQAKAVFSTDKKVYSKRELVNSKIKLFDAENKLVSGNLSVAITDDKDIAVDSLNTILSSLLLSSELKGYIEAPAYYLQNNNRASFALDHLMLTHGWRRYNIPEAIKGNIKIPEKPIELSIEISGTVKNPFLGKASEEAVVTIYDAASDDFEQTTTNKNGEFLFTNIEFPDSIQYYINAYNKRGGRVVELAVDKKKHPEPKAISYASNNIYSANSKEEEKEVKEKAFVEKAEQRAKYDDDIRTIKLSEVEITAEEATWKPRPKLVFNFNRTISRQEIEPISYLGTITFLSFYDITYSEPLIGLDTLRYRGKAALAIIDGVVTQYRPLELIPLVDDIESIDIIKENDAAINSFVVAGSGYKTVINITTRADRFKKDTKMPNATIISPLGFQKPAEFYSPIYDTPESKYQSIPDYRTTIFWKPDVVVEEGKDAQFNFYTSDFPTTYSVVIEGISDDGQIVRHIEKIEVK